MFASGGWVRLGLVAAAVCCAVWASLRGGLPPGRLCGNGHSFSRCGGAGAVRGNLLGTGAKSFPSRMMPAGALLYALAVVQGYQRSSFVRRWMRLLIPEARAAGELGLPAALPPSGPHRIGCGGKRPPNFAGRDDCMRSLSALAGEWTPRGRQLRLSAVGQTLPSEPQNCTHSPAPPTAPDP